MRMRSQGRGEGAAVMGQQAAYHAAGVEERAFEMPKNEKRTKMQNESAVLCPSGKAPDTVVPYCARSFSSCVGMRNPRVSTRAYQSLFTYLSNRGPCRWQTYTLREYSHT